MARHDPTNSEYRKLLRSLPRDSHRTSVIRARTRLGRTAGEAVQRFRLEPAEQLITNLRLLVQDAGRKKPIIDRSFWRRLDKLRLVGNRAFYNEAQWTETSAEEYVEDVNLAIVHLNSI